MTDPAKYLPDEPEAGPVKDNIELSDGEAATPGSSSAGAGGTKKSRPRRTRSSTPKLGRIRKMSAGPRPPRTRRRIVVDEDEEDADSDAMNQLESQVVAKGKTAQRTTRNSSAASAVKGQTSSTSAKGSSPSPQAKGLKRGRSVASAVGRTDKDKRVREDGASRSKEGGNAAVQETGVTGGEGNARPLEFVEAKGGQAEKGKTRVEESDNSSDLVDRLIDDSGQASPSKGEPMKGTSSEGVKTRSADKEITEAAAKKRDEKGNDGVKGTAGPSGKTQSADNPSKSPMVDKEKAVADQVKRVTPATKGKAKGKGNGKTAAKKTKGKTVIETPKGKKGVVKSGTNRKEVALSIARPSPSQPAAGASDEGGSKVQTKLTASPIRSTRVNVMNPRARPLTTGRRLLPVGGGARFPPISEVIDLTADPAENTTATGASSSATTPSAVQPSTSAQPSVLSAAQERIPKPELTAGPVVAYEGEEVLARGGGTPPLGNVYLSAMPGFRVPFPFRTAGSFVQPSAVPGPWATGMWPNQTSRPTIQQPGSPQSPPPLEPSPSVPPSYAPPPAMPVHVEEVTPPSAGPSQPIGQQQPAYPEKLRQVFNAPPPGCWENIRPFELMSDAAPIRPPGNTTTEVPPLDVANLQANWYAHPIDVSLAEIANWPYARADVRRLAANGVENAAERFREYTRCIGPLFAIPPNLMADRTFLLHQEHAQYVELAMMYLSGQRKGSPLTESSLYSMPLPRQDSRAPFNRVWTGTRAANHARGITMDPCDWAAVVTANGRSRVRGSRAAEVINQNDVRLVTGVPRSSFPVWPTRLSELMAPLGPPVLMPPIALYFGVSAENFTPEVRHRYLTELQFEMCIMILMAVAYEVRYSRRIYWYPVELINTVEDTVAGAPNFLERGQTVGAGVDSLQALITVMRKAQGSPESFFCKSIFDPFRGHQSRYCGYEVRDGTTFRHSTSFGAQVAHHRTTVPDTMLQSRENIRRVVMQAGRVGNWPLGDLLSRLEDALGQRARGRGRPNGDNRGRVMDLESRLEGMERNLHISRDREDAAAREIRDLSAQLSHARSHQRQHDHNIDRLRIDLDESRGTNRRLAQDKETAGQKLRVKENELSLAKQRYREFRAASHESAKRASTAEAEVADLATKLASAEKEASTVREEMDQVKTQLDAAGRKVESLRAERNYWRDAELVRYAERPPTQVVAALPHFDPRPTTSNNTRPSTPHVLTRPSTPRPSMSKPPAERNPYDSE